MKKVASKHVLNIISPIVADSRNGSGAKVMDLLTTTCFLHNIDLLVPSNTFKPINEISQDSVNVTHLTSWAQKSKVYRAE